MLEACPPGLSMCIVSGSAFCVTHERYHPCVKRALAAGQVVYDIVLPSRMRVPRTANGDVTGITCSCGSRATKHGSNGRVTCSACGAVLEAGRGSA